MAAGMPSPQMGIHEVNSGDARSDALIQALLFEAEAQRLRKHVAKYDEASAAAERQQVKHEPAAEDEEEWPKVTEDEGEEQYGATDAEDLPASDWPNLCIEIRKFSISSPQPESVGVSLMHLMLNIPRAERPRAHPNQDLQDVCTSCSFLELYEHHIEGSCVRLAGSKGGDKGGEKGKGKGKQPRHGLSGLKLATAKKPRLMLTNPHPDPMVPTTKARPAARPMVPPATAKASTTCTNPWCELKGQAKYAGHCCDKCRQVFANFCAGRCSQEDCRHPPHGQYCTVHHQRQRH